MSVIPEGRLRSIRESRGLSQSEAAVRMGTSRQAYCAAETGGRGVSLEWLWRFSESLGVDPHAVDERFASTSVVDVRVGSGVMESESSGSGPVGSPGRGTSGPGTSGPGTSGGEGSEEGPLPVGREMQLAREVRGLSRVALGKALGLSEEEVRQSERDRGPESVRRRLASYLAGEGEGD